LQQIKIKMADTFKILVPIGFSEQSLLALDQAITFEKAIENAEITLLSVIEEHNGFFKRLFGSKSASSEETLKKEVSTKLKEVAARYEGKTTNLLKTMVAKGVVYEEVARVSELLECDLVVMGTNGKPDNFRKRFIGSNAYRSATLVQPPVVTVKGVRKPEQVDTIIFPLVLDRRSKEKVGPALYYARLFKAQIKIVSVVTDEEETKKMRGHLKQVEKFISDHGITCSAELMQPKENKSVVRNTLKYAYDNDGDLMIITEDSRKRDLTDYFLGSDVQAMLYHSEIPVMCITPSEVKWEAMWDGF
jgi:nucleotide-binding universal stress UspA family protein